MTFGVSWIDPDDAVPGWTALSVVALCRDHPIEDCTDSKTINAAAVARLADLSRAIMVSPDLSGRGPNCRNSPFPHSSAAAGRPADIADTRRIALAQVSAL